MKEIGSIFPLYDTDLEISISEVHPVCHEGKILYSLCREALFELAQKAEVNNRIVLLPAYTCDTVITPFKESGWKCVYYPVDLQLRINVQSATDIYNKHHPSFIIAHPFYGKDLNETEIAFLKSLHEQGCKIVVDLTQCIFSSQKLPFVDYYVGSYRKWFAIPDGGYLQPKDNANDFTSVLDEYDDFISLQQDSMYLRGLYFETNNEEIKSISRRLNKMAVEMTDRNISPHRMSAFSYALMQKEDFLQNQKQRFENYKFLVEKLKSVSSCHVLCPNLTEISTAPLYFTIYTDYRTSLQRELAKHHIYAPVIWPVVYEEVLIDDTVKYIYDKLLAIPIDQRYDEKDMEKIADIIKNFNHD
ncbi:MAG: hypothetical protein IJT51_10270 [Bacteroidales bacterium]|nr:hypothetical protein [Bacteroidales bacterium]